MEEILRKLNGKSTWDISVGKYFTLVAAVCIRIFCIAEFIAYIILFHHLYTHNENMTSFNKPDLNINLGLSRKSMNKRHKKNIISFVGQFGAFLLEIFLLICVILFKIKVFRDFLKQYFGLWPEDILYTFFVAFKALNTITFILASPELRRYFMEKVFDI